MHQKPQIVRFSLRPAALRVSVIWLLFGLQAKMFAASARYPISTARIAEALIRYGLNVAAEDIRLPLPISAASSSPELELILARTAARNLVQLELRCRDSGKCLPFFVLIDVPDGAASALVADVRKDEQFQAGAGPGSPMSQGRAKNVQTSPDRMRAGSHITLLLEDDQMQIQLPAVALDSGAPGLEVRVGTVDHRKTFRAMVVSPTVARGGLE